jgi:hypothetical protein
VREDYKRDCYTQLFRDGGIETVSQGLIVLVRGERGFIGVNIERELIQGIDRFREFWSLVEVKPPMTFGITLSGVRGMTILKFPISGESDGAFDTDVVVVPEIIVDDLSVASHVMLKPMFDYLWQGGGWAASPHYGPDGVWRER